MAWCILGTKANTTTLQFLSLKNKKVTGDESKKAETEKQKSGVLEIAQVEKVALYNA